MQILIIDDDVEGTSLLSEFLKRDGHNVICEYEGLSGLEAALTPGVDLVVLDLMLPGIDGWEVLARLRQERHVPVIMLTSRGEDDDRIRGLELSADDYLSKPFNPRELAARIRAVLRRYEVRSAIVSHRLGDRAQKAYAFMSYVHEDSELVLRFAGALEGAGVCIWLDRNALKPGHRWKNSIGRAISKGDYFIACFSQAYFSKAKTYINEELTLAIEELRQRPTSRAWFIPVLLCKCEVPDLAIGGGETLRSIHWVSLYDNWDEGVRRVLAVIGDE